MQINKNNNDYLLRTSLKLKFNYHSELTVPLIDFDWDILLQLCLLPSLHWKGLGSFWAALLDKLSSAAINMRGLDQIAFGLPHTSDLFTKLSLIIVGYFFDLAIDMIASWPAIVYKLVWLAALCPIKQCQFVKLNQTHLTISICVTLQLSKTREQSPCYEGRLSAVYFEVLNKATFVEN